jgi:biotin transport system substrate-specific component
MNMSLALRSRAPVVVLQVVGLSLVIAAGARINVPFWPVPMTLQTCAVLAIAGIFGARMAVASVLAYLLEGAVGLPVFAAGGPAALTGPTAGYLVGYLGAAAVVGMAHTQMQRAGAMLAATVLIYALGAAWLSRFVGLDQAYALGVAPFLLGDTAKAVLAWALCGLFARKQA